MANFETVCVFPCLCENCHSLVQANLLAKVLVCPHCKAANLTPYDDPRLVETPGPRVVAQWNVREQLGRELILTDGNYRCPKCNRMTLHFAHSDICWD
jgi:hypothetical protein